MDSLAGYRPTATILTRTKLEEIVEKINLDEGIENGTIIVPEFFRKRRRHDCVVKFHDGWYGHPNTTVKTIEQAYRYTESEAKSLISNMGCGEIQHLTTASTVCHEKAP